MALIGHALIKINTLGDIEGAPTLIRPGLEKAIEIYDFKHEVTQPIGSGGTGQGHRVMGTISFKTKLDGSYPLLFQAAAEGHGIETTEFHFFDNDSTGGGEVLLSKIKTQLGVVTRVSISHSSNAEGASAANGEPIEVSVSLSFNKIIVAVGQKETESSWSQNRNA